MNATTNQLAVGSLVKIINCSQCTDLIGKVVSVKSVEEDGRVRLSFGRGRPRKGQPEFFSQDDVEGVNNEESAE